ncbi:MAG: adenylate/guanylate cyclase domain-containing protein [Beijerinckiaceae bacterium]
MVRTTVLIKGPGVEKPGSRAAQLENRNRQLEQRIAWQEGEIGRLAELKRFVAPQVADILLSGAGFERLQVHQSEIVVLFCDLRGFTAFAEAVSPDELMTTLREYHGVLGPLVREFEGTLNHFAGDGVMVFFNDPTPCINPPLRAVSLAAAIKRDLSALAKRWRKRGYDLGFGIGLAQGVATIGQIGFEHRSDYAAIGTVTNIAARLCAKAKDGQVLVTRDVAAAVWPRADARSIGRTRLKGMSKSIAVFELGSIAPKEGATDGEA